MVLSTIANRQRHGQGHAPGVLLEQLEYSKFAAVKTIASILAKKAQHDNTKIDNQIKDSIIPNDLFKNLILYILSQILDDPCRGNILECSHTNSLR